MYEVQLQLIDRLEINLSFTIQNSQPSFEVFILSQQESRHKGPDGCEILARTKSLVTPTVTSFFSKALEQLAQKTLQEETKVAEDLN